MSQADEENETMQKENKIIPQYFSNDQRENVLKHCPKSRMICHKLTTCCLLLCSLFTLSHPKAVSEGSFGISFLED